MMLLHSVKERAIKVKGHAYGSRPGSTVAFRTLTSNLPLGGCILRNHLVPKEPGKLAHSNCGSCCRVSLDLLDLNSKALSQAPRRCLLLFLFVLRLLHQLVLVSRLARPRGC